MYVIREDRSVVENNKGVYVSQSDEIRVINVIHMHALLNVEKSFWLKGESLNIYRKMLCAYVAGTDISKWGWLKSVSTSKYKYVYLNRIKNGDWFRKDGRKYLFPEKLVGAVKEIKSGNKVVFDVNI